MSNSAQTYYCETCHIVCRKKNDYDRHLLTTKHKNNVSGNKPDIVKIFTCKKCKKEYKSRKGLWGHNKTCDKINNTVPENHGADASIINEIKLFSNLLHDIVKNNDEIKHQNLHIQKQILEIYKNII